MAWHARGVRRAALLCVLALAGCGGDDRAPASKNGPQVRTVASGLDTPWSIAWLPDRRALVTERPGRVRLLSASGELRDEPVGEVDVVESDGSESGLLGIAVDPEFADNGFVYLYRTTDGGNEVARYRFAGDRLTEDGVVVRGHPGRPDPRRRPARVRPRRPPLHHDRGDRRRLARPGRRPRGQGPAHRRLPLRRRAAGDLHDRPPQRPGHRLGAGHRPAPDHRARAGQRRRGQRPARGRELRLARRRRRAAARQLRGRHLALRRHLRVPPRLALDRRLRVRQPRRRAAAPAVLRRRARDAATRRCSRASTAACATSPKAPTARSTC